MPVAYQTPSGATTNFNDVQYNNLLSQFGQDKVDQMLAQMNLYRAGSDSEKNSLLDYAKELNVPYSDTTKDYLIESFLNEKASQNAWDRSVFAAKNQYQWMVDDLKKAGLNPFLAMSGLNAGSAVSSGQGVSGGLLTSRKNNQDNNQTNLIKAALTALVSIVGLAIFKK